MLLSSVYILYNFYAGLYVGSISALVLSLFYAYQYYYSRFRNKMHSSVLFGLLGIAIFGVNYFTNSGIHGSTDLIWPVYLLLVFAISPYRQHFAWLVVYLLCFFCLHAIEYYYPSMVQHPFTAGKGQFIDRVTAFPVPVIAIYIIIKFIRQSYDKERQAAENKTVAVQTLMSIISHDLRAPLLNIQNYLGLLQQHDIDTSDRQEVEQTLLKSTDNAMEMLSNLLHWSKSQMEGPKVQMQEVNLLTVLTATLDMEKMQALQKEITLNYTIPDQLNVVADTDMLQLVMRNMISNAVKFTPKGGLVMVDAQMVLDECKITVSDNGTGIQKDQQEKIFSNKTNPAYGTANEKGFGLGLVLCKEFIERQGGRIGFKSYPGQGTSFFIYIKAA